MKMQYVTIGCDPEFMIGLPNSTKVIEGDLICDNMDGHIGTDMHGSQMEIRPRPSKNTLDVLANIRSILRLTLKNNPKLKKLKFVGGHYYGGSPIGGHIHIRSVGKNDSLWGDDDVDDVEPIVKLLDKVLFYGLAEAVDDKKGREARRRRGYGRLSDTRDSESGIEYRTPPCWLVNPTLAFLYLCLAKICALISVNGNDYRVTREMIFKSKKIGFPLLELVAQRIANIPSLVKEEDIRMCIKILRRLRKDKLKINWSEDFKAAWGL